MQKIPGNFPYGIIPAAGADFALTILFILEYLHLFQIELPQDTAYIVAVLLTVLVLFSPVYLLASIYVWRHKSTHKFGYDDQGLYQDGQMIVSWQEVKSVVFQQKYEPWFKIGYGVWAKPAFNPDGTPRGKIKQRLSGSITFYPKTGFGIDQVEVAIPITGKSAPMRRIHKKMKAFVASAGWDSVFDIRMN